MIQLVDIQKTYPGDPPVQALQDIQLHVSKGEIFGVVGLSGAGKSTLIRCVNYLEEPTGGEVLIQGTPLSSLSALELRKTRQKIGMIFQQFNLLSSVTVFENIAMPLRLIGKSSSEIENKVKELLQFVDLSDKKSYYPDQLSGGQKQRVGIARALANDPHILLCDEATSALDPDTTQSVLQLLRRVRDTFGVTILLITHEMEVIRDLCDRVAVMEAGRIVEQGSVYEVFAKPKSSTAKRFVRTIFSDQLPTSVQTKLPVEEQLYRIVFSDENAADPIVTDVIRKFPIQLNVLQGNITELQGKPFGNLIIGLRGEPSSIEEVLAYFQEKKVLVEEVERHAV